MWDSLGVLGLRAGSIVVRGRARLGTGPLVPRRHGRVTSDGSPAAGAFAAFRIPIGRERPQLLASVLRLVAIVVLAALVLSAVAFVTGLALARALEDLG